MELAHKHLLVCQSLFVVLVSSVYNLFLFSPIRVADLVSLVVEN